MANNQDALLQIDENLGFNLIESNDTFHQVDENVLVNDNVPTQGQVSISFGMTGTLSLINRLNPANTIILDDKSTAPHGFYFELEIIADIPSIVISDPTNPSWQFELAPLGGFLNGDILSFSSEYNDKYVYITRGEYIIYLADAVTPGSIWPIIFPGTNTFALTNPNSLIWVSILYYPTYWGV